MTRRSAEFVLHLRPEPAGRDHLNRTPTERLRGVLKRLLRSHGLRCVSVREIDEHSASEESHGTLTSSESR